MQLLLMELCSSFAPAPDGIDPTLIGLGLDAIRLVRPDEARRPDGETNEDEAECDERPHRDVAAEVLVQHSSTPFVLRPAA